MRRGERDMVTDAEPNPQPGSPHAGSPQAGSPQAGSPHDVGMPQAGSLHESLQESQQSSPHFEPQPSRLKKWMRRPRERTHGYFEPHGSPHCPQPPPVQLP